MNAKENKARKFKIANRISFACFGAYYLSFIVLTVVAGNPVFLTTLLVPTCMLLGLLINVSIKYRKADTKSIAKTAKIAALLSICMNGFSITESWPARYTAGTDWEQKEKDIRRYPSIVPAWLFVAVVANFIVYLLPLMFLGSQITHREVRLMILFYFISLVPLIAGQVSSTLALIYAGEKKYAVKSWKSIGIFCALFAGAVLLAFLVGCI